MTSPSLGFIGFGEAAFAIARGLRQEGIDRVFAYDVNASSAELGPRIQSRAKEAGTILLASLEELAERAEVIFSAVVSSIAAEVAEQIAPHLSRRHLYVDLNSTSPATQQKIGRIVSAHHAAFVEAAVMSAVPRHGHRVPMLLSGEAAPALARLLTRHGMNFEILGADVGTASAVKMFRSLIIKGLEALVLECLLAASRYGAEERVFASVGETFPGLDWNQLAHYLMSRTAVHCDRRAREMEEVSQTLEGMEVEPIMAKAAARRLGWCARLGLQSVFDEQQPPKTYGELLEAIEMKVSQ